MTRRRRRLDALRGGTVRQCVAGLSHEASGLRLVTAELANTSDERETRRIDKAMEAT